MTLTSGRRLLETAGCTQIQRSSASAATLPLLAPGGSEAGLGGLLLSHRGGYALAATGPTRGNTDAGAGPALTKDVLFARARFRYGCSVANPITRSEVRERRQES